MRTHVAALSLAAVGCATQPQPSPMPTWRVTPLDSPAPPDSGEPNLASSPDQSVYLTWLESGQSGMSRLRFAARRAGKPWSSARTITAGADLFVNWADFPSLLAIDDRRLYAHWLARNGGGRYGYDVRVASSDDAGESWSAYVVPHRDRTLTEHGFVSMAPASGDAAHLVWLDGRGTSAGAAQGAMALAHTSLSPDGRLGPEQLVDERVCDCCQTAAAAIERGLFVVYRDRSATEVRDVSVARFEDGRWSEPTSLHDDGWEMNGCPVNGPAVAAAGSHVAVAWFTAPGERGVVRLAFSKDGGATFGAPLAVDDGRPLGRVDLVLLPEGDALVVWMEQGPKGTELRARQMGVGRPRGASFMVADSSSARSSGFPRIALAGDEPVVAWRDVGEPPRVRTAILERVR